MKGGGVEPELVLDFVLRHELILGQLQLSRLLFHNELQLLFRLLQFLHIVAYKDRYHFNDNS